MHHPQPRSLLRDAVARRTAAAGALVAAALLPAADLAAQSFYSELVFPTTDAPRAVALGDLNGDGHPDAVTLDTKLFGWTASVSLNSGSGGLLAPTALPIPGVASDVAIGDVTGDGRADLVVGMGFPTGFAVFAGTATGGLSTPHVWVIPNGTTFSLNVDALALGDVNEDGMLDVVTCNRTGGMALQHTSVFLANGTGSFAAPFDATPGVFVRQCLVLGDFNGDRHLDIDISSGPNLLVPGNGRGGFLPAQDTGLGLALDLAAADLDADGHLDLLRVSAGNPGSVGVAPGTGTGAFGAPTAYATGQFPQALVAADIDGDGAIDVATANMGSSAGAVAILRGNGAGALGAPLLIPTGGSGSQTSDLAVADMD
ncbi:MAG TPA: VCBS repeat-containing protein, partial [Planctomycetota bacterium]|nr:VCBS repeat-containing protein [Planctomycetota bacterium]